MGDQNTVELPEYDNFYEEEGGSQGPEVTITLPGPRNLSTPSYTYYPPPTRPMPPTSPIPPPVRAEPRASPAPAPKSPDNEQNSRRNFYILPGISKQSKLKHQECTEGRYDYDHMFHPISPPLPDMMNKCYGYYFDFVFQFIYYLLTFIVAPIILLMVGICSGALNFAFAWIMSPFYNCTEITIPRLARPVKQLLQHCIAPFFITAGKVFSNIRVQYSKVPVHDATAEIMA